MEQPARRLTNPPATTPAIGRALKYLTHYRRQAALPYIFLLIATLSALVVPRLVRGVIDAVTYGVMAKTLLAKLPAIPQAFLDQALPQILSFLKLPADTSLAQLTGYLTAQASGAPGCAAAMGHRHRGVCRAARGVRLPAGLLGGAQLAERGLRPAQRPVRQDPAPVVLATTTATRPAS